MNIDQPLRRQRKAAFCRDRTQFITESSDHSGQELTSVLPKRSRDQFIGDPMLQGRALWRFRHRTLLFMKDAGAWTQDIPWQSSLSLDLQGLADEGIFTDVDRNGVLAEAMEGQDGCQEGAVFGGAAAEAEL